MLAGVNHWTQYGALMVTDAVIRVAVAAATFVLGDTDALQDDLDALQRAVRDEHGPLARDLRFRFHPHVTLAHEVGHEALDAAAAAGESITAEFVVDRLELRALADDGSWDLLRTVPLSGSPTP